MSYLNSHKFLLFISLFLLAGCGGGTGSSNNEVGQVDQGILESFNPLTGSLNEVAVLNINTVFDTGETSQIDSLKICNTQKCWILIDQEDTAQKLKKGIVSKKLTANKSTEKIGSFAVKDEGITVDILKYSYKGKEGKVKLDDGITFNRSTSRDIYLSAEEDLSIVLNSISIPFDESILYLHDSNLEHEFNSGLLLKVPKNTTNTNAIVSISSIVDENSNVPVKSHAIAFISMSEVNFDKNKIPEELEGSVEIYLPVLDDTLLEDYRLYLEGKEIEKVSYEVRVVNNKKYIYFTTKKNIVNANFRKDISLRGSQ